MSSVRREDSLEEIFSTLRQWYLSKFPVPKAPTRISPYLLSYRMVILEMAFALLFRLSTMYGETIDRIVVNTTNKQPIVRIEDRLFDRGWVRSAMATRECGNINFPKYFMAVRPFFTMVFFQELFGLEGSKTSLEKFR